MTILAIMILMLKAIAAFFLLYIIFNMILSIFIWVVENPELTGFIVFIALVLGVMFSVQLEVVDIIL